MKEYEAPSIDFYSFETPEAIMGTGTCPTWCDDFNICVLNNSCSYDLSSL